MSGTAVGFLCVGCGGYGPHHITSYRWKDGHLTELVLYCNRCEHVWREDLTDFDTIPEQT